MTKRDNKEVKQSIGLNSQEVVIIIGTLQALIDGLEKRLADTKSEDRFVAGVLLSEAKTIISKLRNLKQIKK